MNNTQDNSSTRENKKGTVSIRKMTLGVWYKAGYECKLRGITMAEYIEQLITEDLEVGEILNKSK